VRGTASRPRAGAAAPPTRDDDAAIWNVEPRAEQELTRGEPNATGDDGEREMTAKTRGMAVLKAPPDAGLRFCVSGRYSSRLAKELFMRSVEREASQ
jgi:hypothetical protein